MVGDRGHRAPPLNQSSAIVFGGNAGQRPRPGQVPLAVEDWDVAKDVSPLGCPRDRQRRPHGQRVLVGLQLVTAASAATGGGLLTVAPNGSVLHADLSALEGSPFTHWRVPGILLTVLVGGGLFFAGSLQWRDGRHARAVSNLAGLGLVAFEAAELVWIGFQPLEGVFALVGVAMSSLAALDTWP